MVGHSKGDPRALGQAAHRTGVDWNLSRLLQRVAVRLQLHLDIAARRLRVGANGVRFGDERFGLRLVDAVQLGVQRHIQEKPAFVLVEVHGRGHL